MCRVQPPDMPHLDATGLRDQPTCRTKNTVVKTRFIFIAKLATLGETTSWRRCGREKGKTAKRKEKEA